MVIDSLLGGMIKRRRLCVNVYRECVNGGRVRVERAGWEGRRVDW